MRVASPVAAPQAATSSQAQGLAEEARAQAQRRRRKAALAVIIIAAAIGSGLAGAAALSASGRTARTGPGNSAALTARSGTVTGYVDACEGVGIFAGLPHAAATVTALRGRETWKPAGNGAWRLQLPAAVAARQHVTEDHKFYFDLPPGRYVLVARYDRGNGMTFLDMTMAAGGVLHRDLPNLCK